MADALPSDEVSTLATALRGLPAVRWPGGYGEAGLAVVDSIWSISAHYDNHVRPLIARYREQNAGADRHTASDLVQVIDRSGGPDAWADAIGNRQRTSTRNGVLKAAAVHEAATTLCELDLGSKDQLREAIVTDRLIEVEKAWRAVHGQRSGITWRYFLMLLGIPGVKADRMVTAWVEAALGRPVTAKESEALLEEAARQADLTSTDADHRVWNAERNRRRWR